MSNKHEISRNNCVPGKVRTRIIRGLFALCTALFILALTAHAGDDTLDLSDISVIFYGDSRTVGLSYCAGGCTYVGKVSAGYSWMSGEGYSLLKEAMASYPDASVVFCFGVNDMDNVDSYIRFFEDFMLEYPNRSAFFCSVNPIADEYAASNGYTVRNSQVIAFNQRVKDALPDYYLDTYTFLINGGYDTMDGIHYGSDTYVKIQNLTKILVESFVTYPEEFPEEENATEGLVMEN